MYEERTYRNTLHNPSWIDSRICLGESDLLIRSTGDIRVAARALLAEVRENLCGYLNRDPLFRTSLVPRNPKGYAPRIAHRMASSAKTWGVGPMAAVAGAVAEYVGEGLVDRADKIIIENGGDIYARGCGSVRFEIFPGSHSDFDSSIRCSAEADGNRLGVCTSSGTVGHSFSRGRADAVCIVANSAIEADAAATALANRIKGPGDIEWVLDKALRVGICAIVAICGNRLGMRGKVKLLPPDTSAAAC